MIPGRGNNVITVLFSPTSGIEDKEGQDCLGLAMGYMSLESEVRIFSFVATYFVGFQICHMGILIFVLFRQYCL